MAYESFPNDAHNDRSVTLAEHEQIAVALGLSGLLFWSGTAPVYADSTGRQVKLRANVWASIRGTRFNNASETIISIPANTSGNTRIDLVVLRLRRQESDTGVGDHYTISPVVLQGAPAAQNPVAPSPVRGTTSGTGFYDVPLCEVTVPHNASTTTAAQVKTRTYYITGSGYTGRDDWGKPPVEPGVLFHANDTGITYVGLSGGSWRRIADDSGNLTLPFVNLSGQATGWAAPEFHNLRRRNGQVILTITPQRTGNNVPKSTYVPLGRFPDGMRPREAFEGLGYAPSSGNARYKVRTDGLIELYFLDNPLEKNRFVNISPITFFIS